MLAIGVAQILGDSIIRYGGVGHAIYVANDVIFN
jgi:hypothetical protein